MQDKKEECCEIAVEQERISIWSWILSQLDGKDPRSALLLMQIAEKIKSGKLD